MNLPEVGFGEAMRPEDGPEVPTHHVVANPGPPQNSIPLNPLEANPRESLGDNSCIGF